MISAKEKAESLVNQFIDLSDIWTDTAVKCAITHVKGIIDEFEDMLQTAEVVLKLCYYEQVLAELKRMKY